MPMMSLALANSISTSRNIETWGYGARRHVITPIPQNKRAVKKNDIFQKFKEYIKKF